MIGDGKPGYGRAKAEERIAKQLGVAPYVVYNAIYRLWPEHRGSIKLIREALGIAAPKPVQFQPKPRYTTAPAPARPVAFRSPWQLERPSLPVPVRVVTAEELARM